MTEWKPKTYPCDPAFTSQWDTRGDDIAGNKRNSGQKSYWNTDDSNGDIDETLWNQGSGEGYKLNALNHYVFPGQNPLADYGAGWKRKRFRLRYLDDIYIKNGFVHWLNGQGDKTLFHAYVFMNNNFAINPLGDSCPQFNPNSPHHDTDNPVGWVVSAYVSEIYLLGSVPQGIDFVAEKSSDLLKTGSGWANLLEIWIEFSWDPTAIPQGSPCHGYSRMMLYAEKNISNGF